MSYIDNGYELNGYRGEVAVIPYNPLGSLTQEAFYYPLFEATGSRANRGTFGLRSTATTALGNSNGFDGLTLGTNKLYRFGPGQLDPDYGSIPVGPTITNLPSATWGCWFWGEPGSWSGGGFMFSIADVANLYYLNCFVNAQSVDNAVREMQIGIGDNLSGALVYPPGVAVDFTGGVWVPIVGVWDGANITIYVGTEIETTTGTLTQVMPVFDYLGLTAGQPSGPPDNTGYKLDEVFFSPGVVWPQERIDAFLAGELPVVNS